jgi:integrase
MVAVDFKAALLHVRRAKKGTPATHPPRGDELRALRRLQREQAPPSSYVFTSECGSPFSTPGLAKMVERARAEAGFEFKAHPHMLRHACGYALANKGHDTRAALGPPGRTLLRNHAPKARIQVCRIQNMAHSVQMQFRTAIAHHR